MKLLESQRLRYGAIGLLLVGINLAAFFGVKDCQFIILDDPSYILGNPEIRNGLTWHGIQWAFEAGLFYPSSFVDYWQPVTCLSRMLDIQFFGLNPVGHHLMNLLIHILNALLLFHVLWRMTCHERSRVESGMGRSAMVAALFAVHPLRVEAVAWVTERKELLSGFFWMLTLWAYLNYGSYGSNKANKMRIFGWYALALFFFILGLMSKPMIITLPLVLLLLDYWPLSRFGSQGAAVKNFAFMEKLPFLLLSFLYGLVILQAQGSYLKYPSPWEGMESAVISYAFYMIKTFLPHPMAIFYPKPLDGFPPGLFIVALLCLVVPIFFTIWKMRSFPFLFTGWFWFLVTLAPVAGLNDMMGADRFTYIPLIGIFILLVWGAAEWKTAWKWRPGLLKAGSALLMGSCVIASAFQVRYWRDSLVLFEHAAKVTQDSYIVHDNLGSVLLLMGRVDEAIPHFRFDLLVYPDSPQINNSLGKALVQKGEIQTGIEHFKRAIKADPHFADAWLNLGDALMDKGESMEAISLYTGCLRLEPNNFRAENNLGMALGLRGDWDEALRRFFRAVQMNPSYARGQYNLGVCLARRKKFTEAERHLETALRLDPAMKETQSALAKIKSQPHN